MPFVALDVETNKRVDITKIEYPRLALKRENMRCQLCHTPLLIKAGIQKKAHFAHVSQCSSDYGVHPETEDHRRAKLFIAEHLQQEFKDYTSATIEYEVPIPEVKRVADLLATFPMGWRVAHEIQLAPITVEELRQRTEDYECAGIDVVWWLGKRANTDGNRAWCEDAFGYAVTIFDQR